LRHPALHGWLLTQGVAPTAQTPLTVEQLQAPDTGVVRNTPAPVRLDYPLLPLFFVFMTRQKPTFGQNEHCSGKHKLTVKVQLKTEQR
jgi:hypothetical protein